MSLSQLFLCMIFNKSQLSTTVKKLTNFVIQPRPLSFRRQEISAPKRTDTYNPNYGYEPYWPDGGWVFDRLIITTEKQEGTFCGKECPEMYRQFGVFCGRDKDYTYKTFNNYCELRNEDCEGKKKWMILYRGVCISEFEVFITAQTQLFTRASQFEYTFDIINPTPYRPIKDYNITSTSNNG